jgi:hypothetical protein
MTKFYETYSKITVFLNSLTKDVQAPAKASSPGGGGRGGDEVPLRSFVTFSREKFWPPPNLVLPVIFFYWGGEGGAFLAFLDPDPKHWFQA